MEDKVNISLIYVYAGDNELGPVNEEIPAIQLGDNTYELLSSPGLTLNLAKGDVVLIDEKNKPAKVLKRGGNFCIQIYANGLSNDVILSLENGVQEKLGGTLDGVNEGNLSLSVPAKTGIDRLRSFFDEFTAKTGVQWYYGNIYKNFEDPDDETLLYWWTF